MRLYSGQIAPMSKAIIAALTEDGAVETEAPAEVAQDLEAVMQNYLTIEREATDQAKDMLQQRGLPQSEFARLRKLTAEQKGIKVGEEILDYLLNQFIEMLMHSHHVEEVFVEDHDLRRKMRPAVKKYLAVEDELDQQVRGRMKHMQKDEGSRAWEIEYQRVMGDIKQRRGL